MSTRYETQIPLMAITGAAVLGSWYLYRKVLRLETELAKKDDKFDKLIE